jgi:hypothetical protein
MRTRDIDYSEGKEFFLEPVRYLFWSIVLFS